MSQRSVRRLTVFLILALVAALAGGWAFRLAGAVRLAAASREAARRALAAAAFELWNASHPSQPGHNRPVFNWQLPPVTGG